MSIKVAWYSIDPRSSDINYYPKNIASVIEKAFKNNDKHVFLGRDFFSATIHFNHPMYQTTPPHYYSNNNFKIQGYRSIGRIVFDNHDITYRITVYSYMYNNEWRITNDYLKSDKIIFGQIPDFVILDDKYEPDKPSFWTSNDLELYDKEIIVWLWSTGNYDDVDNLLALDYSCWNPYIKNHNQIIENEYINNKEYATITLPFDDSIRNIIFQPNNCYAKQIDPVNNKVRLAKRTIMHSSKLKNILDNMTILSHDLNIRHKINNSHDTPIEYLCPLSQTIMIEPVRTSDNNIYDKRCIKKWVETKHTSPLTGLHLDDISITPDIDITNNIQVYVKSIYDNI